MMTLDKLRKNAARPNLSKRRQKYWNNLINMAAASELNTLSLGKELLKFDKTLVKRLPRKSQRSLQRHLNYLARKIANKKARRK